MSVKTNECAQNESYTHRSVLLSEATEALKIIPSGCYIDATFGRGGHSEEILRHLGETGRLVVIDKDVDAVRVAEKLASNDKRVIVRQGSFTLLQQWIVELGLKEKINGILLDLGVSSPQLDDAKRGFSFMRDGPLDMRMDATQKLTAEVLVNRAREKELIEIFREYGEERYSKKIAAAIVKEREILPISTTGRLAEIVSNAHPRWERHKHPATRVFQALRIAVNNELKELESCLEQCLDVLAVNGRLVVISFHSLEDQIVKKFMRNKIKGNDLLYGLPIMHDQLQTRIKKVGKTIRASVCESKQNPRARSAILRIMEKIK